MADLERACEWLLAHGLYDDLQDGEDEAKSLAALLSQVREECAQVAEQHHHGFMAAAAIRQGGK